MLGAGTVINPIIKVVTTVAILGAVYLFILKPVFDTTDKAFDSFTGFDDLSSGIQNQVDSALDSTSDPDRLRSCIQRAIDDGANQRAVDRCLDRFG
jgi:hypothetical protein